MAKLVSSTYGDAYISLMEQKGKLLDAKEEAAAIQDVFVQHPELEKMLHHPKIIKEEKEKIIENIFKTFVSKDMVGFLRVIVKKDRSSQIPDILDYIVSVIKKREGIGMLHVKSAVALTEEQKDHINARMTALSEYHSFETVYEVDPALIGGLVLTLDDRVVDSSIRTKLSSMGRQLSQIQLKEEH